MRPSTCSSRYAGTAFNDPIIPPFQAAFAYRPRIVNTAFYPSIRESGSRDQRISALFESSPCNRTAEVRGSIPLGSTSAIFRNHTRFAASDPIVRGLATSHWYCMLPIALDGPMVATG